MKRILFISIFCMVTIFINCNKDTKTIDTVQNNTEFTPNYRQDVKYSEYVNHIPVLNCLNVSKGFGLGKRLDGTIEIEPGVLIEYFDGNKINIVTNKNKTIIDVKQMIIDFVEIAGYKEYGNYIEIPIPIIFKENSLLIGGFRIYGDIDIYICRKENIDKLNNMSDYIVQYAEDTIIFYDIYIWEIYYDLLIGFDPDLLEKVESHKSDLQIDFEALENMIKEKSNIED